MLSLVLLLHLPLLQISLQRVQSLAQFRNLVQVGVINYNPSMGISDIQVSGEWLEELTADV